MVDLAKRSNRKLYTFLNGVEVTDLRTRIQNEIKLPFMTNDDMLALYDLATYENALFGSSFMNGFFQKKEDRDMMEFLNDLKYFYKRGFAYEISYRQSTPLLYELYQDMMSMKQGNTQERL